ncbi:MAG: chemotaxis-specific protein-glutamate methyltransferase CheB [Planctomycetes bacterium]|nr:chemotaxis-specific protein-glutamate methyltransferase CheB [Planctomycetota bacterium]
MVEERATRARVLVVDGDAGTRQTLARQLSESASVEVVGTAINARTAMPKTASYRPDVLTVDLVSAEVEGLWLAEALRRQRTPVGLVLMVADRQSADALQSRTELAPFDVVLRDDTTKAFDGRILPAVLHAAGSFAQPTTAGDSATEVATTAPSCPVPVPAIAAPSPRPKSARRCIGAQVVGIGTSTGGPNALARVLPGLPADFPLPILIVQHMPPDFTASLAQSLSRTCKLRVREAKGGELLAGGEVLIAPGGRHMRVARTDQGIATRITEDPPENSCRPAVDYLFRSLREVYGATAIAVMMTGMGEDGFAGCQQLRSAGAYLIAQDAASCTVYGMPRGPIESGIVDVVAPLDELATRICEAAGAR